ncbi:hypothetical protein [Amycolatopsis sp.]|uniref:hypothetical protein n=1 Tax=Amycolatopsis sp. TaxID=37632 RepID=UPI002620DD12|nr:hypothetical protein [Amycolatopsis sp.]
MGRDGRLPDGDLFDDLADSVGWWAMVDVESCSAGMSRSMWSAWNNACDSRLFTRSFAAE